LHSFAEFGEVGGGGRYEAFGVFGGGAAGLGGRVDERGEGLRAEMRDWAQRTP